MKTNAATFADADQVIKWQGSTLQHGKYNDRIYLMALDPKDLPEILRYLSDLAERHQYGKIVGKIPQECQQAFVTHGYSVEAHIPRCLGGYEDVLFVSRFLDKKRSVPEEPQRAAQIRQLAADQDLMDGELSLPLGYQVREANLDQVEEMREVYRQVFATYPFPILDTDYLRQTMLDNVVYFCVTNSQGEIVALSSAEIDQAGQSAEMTDFAVLPAERGRGLATVLLQTMQKAMRTREICTCYSIARALSPGMNITFGRLGYLFGGTLVNNTNIAGRLESMNVWFKHLG